LNNKGHISIEDLQEGFIFPILTTNISNDSITNYLNLIKGDNLHSSQELLIAPPAAIAGIAIGQIINTLEFPAGVIHLSQEIEIVEKLESNNSIDIKVIIEQKKPRKSVILMTLSYEVTNTKTSASILKSKTTFIVPESKNI
jgi:hypothetical protein